MPFRADVRKSGATAACAVVLLVAACAPLAPQRGPACPCAPLKPPASAARYEPVEFRDLPGWAASPAAASMRPFIAGCARIAAASALQAACEAARALPAGDDQAARRFFESAFTAYAVVAPDGTRDGIVTGYYEPVLLGSRTKSEHFSQPVYGVPDDLVVVDLAGQYPELRGLRLRGRLNGNRLEPYYTRGEIGAGENGFRAPVLAWVADPVELFFLQIQGSGQIQLDSGERIRVGYGDQNGHPYRSLGRHLIDEGELSLDQASMQGIKAWAAANPERLQASAQLQRRATCSSASCRPRAGRSAPRACRSSAGYSVAVDPRFVPARRAGLPGEHVSALAGPARAASSWRRTPAARSAAQCAPTSTGASGPRPARWPDACASRVGCGFSGRAGRRCRAPCRPSLLRLCLPPRLVELHDQVGPVQAALDALAVGEEQRRRRGHVQ